MLFFVKIKLFFVFLELIEIGNELIQYLFLNYFTLLCISLSNTYF
jgi:hypothetical protein